MAVFLEKRGHEWDDAEREKRKPMNRKVQGLVGKVQEQVRRIAIHAPTFKTQTDQAFTHLAAGLGAVATLDLSNRGAKYKKLSPEEFDRIIATLPDLMKPWHALLNSPDFAAAVRAKNREIRSENERIREHNRVVAAQNAAMYDKMDAILQKADGGDIVGALDMAAKEGLL